jgi:hypothetical protein
MKQTAVEWLAEQFDSIVELYPSQFEKINNAIEQAKEMEEQNIKNAYENGNRNGAERVYYNSDRDDKSAEQYYNETFNK